MTVYADSASLRVEVASEIPGVPNPVVDRSVVLASRDLCDQVALWQETMDINPSGQQLDLSAMEDDKSEVVRVMPRGVSAAGERLAQYNTPAPRDPQSLGYYVRQRRLITLIGDPGSPVTVRSQMRPKATASEVPAHILSDYHEIVVFGALARLLRMPNQSWTNGELANAYFQQFMERMRRVRTEVDRVPA